MCLTTKVAEVRDYYCCCCRRKRENKQPEEQKTGNRAVIYVGLAFFALFSGYTVFSSLLPALQPKAGPFIVALNYVAYAAGSVLTPGDSLEKHRRLAFSSAAVTYVGWMITVQAPESVALWLGAAASIINGFGAGLLWSTQGDWISQWCGSDQNRSAYLHGIFLFLYSLSGLIGNLGALGALLTYADARSLQWALCCTSAFGCLLLACTPKRWLHARMTSRQNPPPVHTSIVCDVLLNDTAAMAAQYRSRAIAAIVSSAPNVVIDDPESTAAAMPGQSETNSISTVGTAEGDVTTVPTTAIGRWKACRLLFQNRNFVPCIGAIVAVGVSAGYLWVALPSSLRDASLITGVFAIYSVSYGITSLCSTIVLRKYSPRAVFATVAVFLTTPVYVYFAVGHDTVYREHARTIPYIVGAATFVFGIVMNLFTTSLFTHYTSTLSRCVVSNGDLNNNSEDNTVGNIVVVNLAPHAFCVHGALYCIVYALTSACVSVLSLRTLSIVTCTLTWIGIAVFMASFCKKDIHHLADCR